MQARTIAKGKCYACGARVTVAEAVSALPMVSLAFRPKTNQMVMHERPECAIFICSDSDAFVRQCNLARCDEISDALDDLFK